MKEQDRDLLMRFDAVTRRLRESNVDLSKIKIALDSGNTSSYVTKRIMQDLKNKY